MFADLGARVVLVGRSHERLAAVRDVLVRDHGEDRFPTVVIDMASLDSVQAAAERVLTTEMHLDVLVDNYLPIVDRLGAEVDQIETATFGRSDSRVHMRTLRLKRGLAALRRIIGPQRDTVLAHLHRTQEEYLGFDREHLGWAMYLLRPVWA